MFISYQCHLEREQNCEDGEGDESDPNFENRQAEPSKKLAKLEKHFG